MRELKEFKRQLKTFIINLDGIVGSNQDYMKSRTILLNVLKINPYLVVQNYVEYFFPHKDDIMNFRYNFLDEYENYNYGSINPGFIRYVLISLNDKSRENIFKYLQVLLFLSEKICG